MQAYETKVTYLNLSNRQHADKSLEIMSGLGLEGWQLVTVIPAAGGCRAFYQRPLTPEEAERAAEAIAASGPAEVTGKAEVAGEEPADDFEGESDSDAAER